jgi:hypothetical protein
MYCGAIRIPEFPTFSPPKLNVLVGIGEILGKRVSIPCVLSESTPIEHDGFGSYAENPRELPAEYV